MNSSGKWYTAKIDEKHALNTIIETKQSCIAVLERDLDQFSTEHQSQSAINAKKRCIKALQDEVADLKEKKRKLDQYYKLTELPILLFSEYYCINQCKEVTYYWFIPDFNLKAQTSSTDIGFLKGALDLRPIFMNEEFCTTITSATDSFQHALARSDPKSKATLNLRCVLEEILSNRRVKTWEDVRARIAKHYKLPKSYLLSKQSDNVDYAH